MLQLITHHRVEHLIIEQPRRFPSHSFFQLQSLCCVYKSTLPALLSNTTHISSIFSLLLPCFSPIATMGLKGFVEGGIASIVAGASTHPLDLIKVRMQLQGESHLPNPSLQLYRPALAVNSAAVGNVSISQPRVGPISIGVRIIQLEGVAALFSGVSATMLRQTLYSTTRMGLYEIIKNKWTDKETGNLPLTSKILAGLIAGGVGAAVGNPADVAMVRMQADGRLPIDQRRNYKSVIDALSQMTKQEGVGSLWRGSALTVNRAMIVTASQLATYDQAKETILEKGVMGDGIGTHVTASFAAGFVAAVASNPIDVIKTRVMNMKVAPGAEPPYSGALDCALKTVRAEGPMALYKGFIPTISRQGPFTVVLFVTLEQVRKLLKDF
ncbi:mitochondrial uncoupling protein 5 [Gossypium hirsutum]|uniref:Mitochondrial uncoupling protein 5 n=1 Tax=Gossypium hirsutum TaxID=3635 RepID=A0A1U8JQE4_GOSHI|nr:mitochondrial uncoupling protein 5-like [Gossypium hirsutum]